MDGRRPFWGDGVNQGLRRHHWPSFCSCCFPVCPGRSGHCPASRQPASAGSARRCGQAMSASSFSRRKLLFVPSSTDSRRLRQSVTGALSCWKNSTAVPGGKPNSTAGARHPAPSRRAVTGSITRSFWSRMAVTGFLSSICRPPGPARQRCSDNFNCAVRAGRSILTTCIVRAPIRAHANRRR